MTKQEFKMKINKIMDEAIKIDRINSIVEDMEFTMKKQDDLSDIARDALVIGYADMLRKTHEKIRFIWLHLHELRSAVDELDDHFLDLPTEEEMAASREVNGDD